MNTTENPDLGTLLKNRRHECGLTVDDVANRTRIRRTYLLALEENRFQDLPGEAYIHGFLRNYANALGLQPSVVIDMYRVQRGDGSFEEAKVIVEQKSMPAHRRNARGVLPWLGVILLVVGAFAIIALQDLFSRPEPLPPREPVAVIDTNPAPPPAEMPAAGDAAAPGPAPADSTAASPEGAVPPTPAPPLAQAPGAPPAVALPQEVRPVLPPFAAPPAGVPPASAPAAPAPATPPPAEIGAAGEKPLIFDFTGNGLVRLESTGANQIEFIGDNRPPQRYELTASAVLNWKVRQSARINIVDPAAVKIWVDQRPLNLTGRGAIVLQRVAAPATE